MRQGLWLPYWLARALRELTTKVMQMQGAPAATESANTRAVLVLFRAKQAASIKGLMAFIAHAAHKFLHLHANNALVQWGESSSDDIKSLKTLLESSVKEGIRGRDVPSLLKKHFPNYQSIPDTINAVFGREVDGRQLLQLPKGCLRSGEGEHMLRTRLTGSASLQTFIELDKRNRETKPWGNFVVAVDPNNPDHGRSDDLYLEPPLLRDLMPDRAHRAADRGRDRRDFPRFGAGRTRFGALVEEEEGAKRRRLLSGGTREYATEDAREAAEDALETDPWGTVGGAAAPAFSAAFKERWAVISRTETDPLRRAAKLAYLGQPVRMQTLSKSITSDAVFPFGFVLLRPYMTYAMASAILTVAGAATGETLVGHADFQLADNVVQKMHIGNFTMYLKSVVYQPHHVWIADNVMACGYVGGNNCDFRTPSNASQPPQGASDPSLFACLVPYDSQQEGSQYAPWEQELPNPLDITGNYSSGNPALETLKNSVQRRHYASSPFYTSLFGWDNSDQATLDPDSMGTNNRYNTLCFAGHQAMFNPASQRFDLVQENTGHRGNRIYAGAGKVWRGLAKLLEPQNFNTTHGGNPVRTMTTLAV
jgi:hypothetical protein